MRHVIAALAVVTCAVLSAGAADDEKYTSKEGKFTIRFPAGAKVTTDTKKVRDGDMHVTTVEKADKKYTVVYREAALKGIPPKTFLDGVEKGLLNSSGGKLESSTDIEFGKDRLPGREIATDRNGDKGKARIILGETRVYAIMVGGSNDFATSKEATTFLDSFEITK